MDYSKYQYKILCEDRAHYNFVRGWLIEKGANSRKLNCYGELPHKGSGKQFVQQNFVTAMEETRRKNAIARTFLIVVLDADNNSADTVASSFGNHENDDPVFFVIAKWSMDTWVRFLMDPVAVDEETSCKQDIRNKTRDAFTQFGRKLAGMNLEGNDTIPESLKYSYHLIRNKKSRLHLI